ncbi:MAG: hypothetical protein HY332_06775 [Chloroflexi bacterium]|nr:hypothetical protein [Chloroflexota bacterium]
MGTRFDIFSRFADDAKQVLVRAQEDAQRLNHNWIGSEHLLLGQLRVETGGAARVLASLGAELDKARTVVVLLKGRGERMVIGEIRLTPRARRVLNLTFEEAVRLGHEHIGTEHLLLGLVRDAREPGQAQGEGQDGDGTGARVLHMHGIDLDEVHRRVLQALSHRSRPPGAPEV